MYCVVLYSIVSGRFIHGGQILNGLAGPVTMAAPPLISATWFPASQRTTATSLGILSGNIGFSLAFVIGNVSKSCACAMTLKNHRTCLAAPGQYKSV